MAKNWAGFVPLFSKSGYDPSNLQGKKSLPKIPCFLFGQNIVSLSLIGLTSCGIKTR